VHNRASEGNSRTIVKIGCPGEKGIKEGPAIEEVEKFTSQLPKGSKASIFDRSVGF
jgi:hypothetical protein